MRLRDLQSINDEPEHVHESSNSRAYEIERRQPDIAPGHPDWTSTVYFDERKFPNHASIERIEKHYAQKYPGRSFTLQSLKRNNLYQFSISRYPLSEKIFRRRGFVADLDVDKFMRGDQNVDKAYVMYNKEAVHLQLAVVSHFLESSARWKDIRSTTRIELSGLIGGERNLPIPLIERDGILWPCRQFWRKERIHFAYQRAPSAALDQGDEDPFELCYAMPDEIAEQIQFEAKNSQAIFNGASKNALLLWQTQTLGILRKAAWETEIITSPSLNTVQTAEATAQSKTLKEIISGRMLTKPDYEYNFDRTVYQSCLKEQQDKYEESLQDAITENNHNYGSGLGLAEYHHGIATDQNVVATLHGSTFLPRFNWDLISHRSHPLHWLTPVAEWIGKLKRQRHAILTKEIAECLAAIFGEGDFYAEYDARLRDFAPIIEDRLGSATWSMIADASQKILNGSGFSVSVVYDWTQNPEKPWAAESRDDGTIVIRGPLLDFPVSRVSYWNSKAAIIEKEGGLAFQRDNRDKVEPAA